MVLLSKRYIFCGSLKYLKEMHKLAKRLGVTPVTLWGKDIYIKRRSKDFKEAYREHYKKIDEHDGVIVYNLNGEIGCATTAEMTYALLRNKDIIFVFPKIPVDIQGLLLHLGKTPKFLSD